MTRINLLPWRELKRKEQQRQFFVVAIGSSVLMVLIIAYVHFHFAALIDAQNFRNSFISGEIKIVEKKIKAISDLESDKKKLLARMNIIQDLQSRRPEIVHIFEEIMTLKPEGIYLTNIRQEGLSIVMEGIAQSNGRVSEYMRNIDQSKWLADPQIGVVEANTGDLLRTSKFTLFVKQKSAIDSFANEENDE